MQYFTFDFIHPEQGLDWLTYYVKVEGGGIQQGLLVARRIAQAEGYPTLKLIHAQEITEEDYNGNQGNQINSDDAEVDAANDVRLPSES